MIDFGSFADQDPACDCKDIVYGDELVDIEPCDPCMEKWME